MVGWSAFGGAVLLGVVLLGFCAYELTWKFHRLTRDLGGLTRVTRQLQETQRELVALSGRLGATGRREG